MNRKLMDNTENGCRYRYCKHDYARVMQRGIRSSRNGRRKES